MKKYSLRYLPIAQNDLLDKNREYPYRRINVGNHFAHKKVRD